MAQHNRYREKAFKLLGISLDTAKLRLSNDSPAIARIVSKLKMLAGKDLRHCFWSGAQAGHHGQ